MATAVLFITWHQLVSPAEPEKAYGWLATEGHAFIHKNEGTYFERVEHIGLAPHGEGIHGCMILFGERAKLDEFRRLDEFEAFVGNMTKRFTHVAVLPGLNWDGIQLSMKRMRG